MIDPVVERLKSIIIKELKAQSEGDEPIFFREEDSMIEGRLDIDLLATVIVENGL